MSNTHQRNSPGVFAEKIKSLGRKQVSGFAGGVIGSAVNPKNYYMRNLRKSEESSRGRANGRNSSQGSRISEDKDRDIVNGERTLSIDSPNDTSAKRDVKQSEIYSII